MLDLTSYIDINSAQSANSKIINGLVAISNLKSTNIDTQIISISGNDVVVAGDYSTQVGRYVVLGHEIAYIDSAVYSSPNTTLTLVRERYGTLSDSIDLTDYYIRTVDIFEDNTLDWSIDNYSNSKTQVFPFTLETGSVTFRDNISNWAKNSLYDLKKKKSAIYLFKGFGKQRILKYTMFASNKAMEGASKTNPEKIMINFNDKFIKWFNVRIRREGIIQNQYPIEFFRDVLEYPEELITYKNGNTETDFNNTNYMFLSEYEKFGDLLKEYAKTGVRFCFNELEQIVITTDLIIDTLSATGVNVINDDILTIKKSDEEAFVINKITGSYYERGALYNFAEDYNSQFVYYSRNITTISFTLIDADDVFNVLQITDATLAEFSDQGQDVTLVDEATDYEIHGKILNYEKDISDNTVTNILVGMYDKDSILNPYGKLDELKTLGYDGVKTFTLYYSRNELPTIYKQQLDNGDGDNISSSLKLPLRPQITGQTEVPLLVTEAVFGSPQNLENGTYIGQYEELDNLFGTFTLANKLTYNRELVQFTTADYPPIFALSTQISSALGRGDDKLVTYDTFDNSDLEITIEAPDDQSIDAVISYKNKKTITTGDLITLEQTNLTQITGGAWEITVGYYNSLNVGDVVTIKEPASFTTPEERTEFTNNKNTNWIIERLFIDSGNYYMTLNGSLKDTFDFTVYPATSIVYLQEFYIKGNPIREYVSPFEVTDTTSIEEYDEQEQQIDGKLLDFKGVARLTDYYKRGFCAIANNESDKKYILPLKIRNNLALQKYDLITVTDTLYTNYDSNTTFIILGIKEQDATKGDNNIYYVMNINNSSVDEQTFDVKKTLAFIPVADVSYTHTGNEGSPIQDPIDYSNTNTVSSIDDKYGYVAFKPIGAGDLKASVVDFDGDTLNIGTIVIGDTKYSNFFDDTDEYRIIKIDNEYLLARILSYSVGGATASFTIVKRPLFEGRISTATNIVARRLVEFNETVSINIDGNLETQNIRAGNETDYMKFNLDDGTQIASTSNINLKTINGGNTISELNFDKAGTNSYLKLNYDGSYYQQQLGIGLVDDSGTFNGAFIGDGALANKNYFKYTSSQLDVKSTGDINISNSNNILNFDSAGADSYLKLNATANYYAQQLGEVTEKVTGSELSYNGFFAGNPEDLSTEYIKYDGSTVTISGNVVITGGSVNIDAHSSILQFTDTDSYIRLNYDGGIASNYGLRINETSSTNKFVFDDSEFTVISQGIVDISNNTNYNKLYMDVAGSYLHLNTNGTATISDLLQLGDNTSSSYLKYTNSVLDLKSTGTINFTTDDFTLNTNGSITLNATSDLTINSGSTVGITTDNFTLTTTGVINLSNTNNALKLDVATNSYLHFNMTDPATNPTNFLQIGDTTDSNILYYNTTDGLVCKIGSSDTTGTFTLGNTDNYISYTDTNGIQIKSNKIVDISNTNNKLYFAPTGSTSYLKLATDGSEGILEIGNTSGTNYLQYTSNLVNIKSNGTIDISNTNNFLYFGTGGADSYVRMNTNKIKIGDDAVGSNSGLYVANHAKYATATNGLQIDLVAGAFDFKSTGTISMVTDNFTLNTSGTVDIDNNSGDNVLYMGASDSRLQLNKSGGYHQQQIGSGLTDSVDADFDGLFLGDGLLTNGHYVKYNGTKFKFGENTNIAGTVTSGDAILVKIVAGDTVCKYGEIDKVDHVFGFDFTSPVNPTTEYFKLADSTNDVDILNLIEDSVYTIKVVGTGNWTSIGASSATIGVIFQKNAVASTGTGTATQYTQGMELRTQGTIDISNNNNALYFETGTTLNSYLRMNSNSVQIGYLDNLTGTYGLTLNTANGLFLGDTNTDSDKYLSYNGTDLTIKTDKGYIGSSSTNTFFNITDSIIGINATDPTTIPNTKFQIGTVAAGTDVLNYSSSSGLFIRSSGNVVITNTYNKLYFGTLTTNSYIRMNSNEQQIGRVTGLTGKVDFDGFYFGNTTLANNKYIYYDGIGLNISGDITVGSTIAGTAASIVKSGAAAGAIATFTFKQDEAPTTYKEGDIWVDTDSEEEVTYVAMADPVDEDVYGEGVYGEELYGGNWRLIGTNNSESLTYTTVKIGKDAVDTGKDGFLVTTNGWVDINNTNNRLYFDPTDTGNSYLKMATDGSNGSLEVGDITSTNYFKYSSGGLDVKTTGTVDINTTNFSLITTGTLDLDSSTISMVTDNFTLTTAGDITISNTNNSLNFDSGTNTSYLKLNKGATYYNQQIGSDLEDSIENGASSYDGFFFGDPTISNQNFFKYNQDDNSSMFAGKYFNETAYISTKEEFISALDITKSTNGYDGTNEFKFINDNGLSIKNIVITNSISLSGLSGNHFSKLIDAGDIISNIDYEIVELGNTDWTSIGASASPFVGEIFTATSSGSGTGTAYIELNYIIPNNDINIIYGDGEGELVASGSLVVGESYTIKTLGTTDFTLIGADSNIIGAIFTATGVGTGTGTVVESYGVSIDFEDYGLKLDDKITTNDLKFKNMGSLYNIAGGLLGTLGIKYSININSQSIYMNNLRFYNIKQRIGDNNLRIQQGLTNIVIESYDPSISYIFNNCVNLDNIGINIKDDFTNPTSSYFFDGCRQIKNIVMITKDINTYYDVNIFNDCSNMVNIDFQFIMCRKFFNDCEVVSNVIARLDDDFKSPVNTEYLIEGGTLYNNIKISNVNYYDKYFKDVSYITNCSSTINPTENSGITYDSNNSWNGQWVTKTATGSLDTHEDMIIATTSSITLTIPSTQVGREYTIANTSAGSITIAFSSGTLLIGSTTVTTGTISKFQYNGTGWYRLI